ncbi:hypothetical protein THRCLA_07475 [Thraustotheca clavata]|uniref:Uncharacterized protein n=1 Tax=Thraustotheca clavata TaxID=74557 RepID=A0A1V9ZD30_9STRA|nr:hypothetical protein THRCLA_07475 [Thraustotheca clavata]
MVTIESHHHYRTYGYHNYYNPALLHANYEYKCKYAFKSCPNTRSAKKNGEMHKLCEYHRRKANNVQKYYARRKRQSKCVKSTLNESENTSLELQVEPYPFVDSSQFKTQAIDYDDCCKYAFKNCPNVRSQKRTGGLHTLCEYHRQKANIIQKAYAQKKRRHLLGENMTSPACTRGLTGVEPIPFDQDTQDMDLDIDDYVDLIHLLEK